MASRLIKAWLAATPAILTPAVAFAHTGVGDTSGFVHGFGIQFLASIMSLPC
jgi:hydrogenase/urease accessory protein HupE